MDSLNSFGLAGLILAFITLWISYKGFKDQSFKDRYCFDIDSILIHKEYIRLISSGFLHANWAHLIFNLLALFAFGPFIEQHLGIPYFLILYFSSMIGGDLFALYIHRQHGDYRALGASGATVGIMFSSIALNPHMEISPLGLIQIPGWLFGIIYVLASIYGIKTKRDNIGHEAHLAGGITGMLITLIMEPDTIKYHYITITLILTPVVVFIYLIYTRATFLLIDHNFTQQGARTIEDKYNSRKRTEEKEIDAILEKIHQKGMNSLTRKEKERLEKHSQKQ